MGGIVGEERVKGSVVAGEDGGSIPAPQSKGPEGRTLGDYPAHCLAAQTLDNSRAERQEEVSGGTVCCEGKGTPGKASRCRAKVGELM